MQGRVLVVEDDCAIADVICDIVKSDGLECVCVSTDRDAYIAIPTQPPIRALVVDINLGTGTTGYDVARFARQVIPAIPVIYVTGQGSPLSFGAFGVPDSAFVQKPFNADDILQPLRDRLGCEVGVPSS
jgi:DNA-binding NtrC family response regulator